jgi:TM2 domain-containing membrane protein YozV
VTTWRFPAASEPQQASWPFLGVHRFYMGDTKGGVIRLLLSLICVSGIIGLVEGIIYLTKTDEEFHEIYEVGMKEWF